MQHKTPMGKFSTLIYLYDNFDEFNEITNNVNDFDDTKLRELFKLVEKNTKKVPDEIVQNLIEFANSHS